MDGVGVDEDPEIGFYWFMRSAAQGDADAQYAVGLCYEEGMGVEVDLDEAREWYQRAAKQGHKEAKRHLKK